MIARVIYLLFVPIISFAVQMGVALAAAVLMPAGLIVQAIVTVPIMCVLTAWVFSILLRRVVVSEDQQVTGFKQKTFLGSFAQLAVLSVLIVISVGKGIATPSEAMVLSLVLLIVGQWAMLRFWWVDKLV